MLEFLKYFGIMFLIFSALVGICIGIGVLILWALDAGTTGIAVLVLIGITIASALTAWDMTKK